MDYYSDNATTNVQIFTTLHAHYNAKLQASYKMYIVVIECDVKC